MILHVTELRKQLFNVLKRIDEGEEVTIVKKDTNKRYKLVAVKEAPKKDIVKIAKRMGKIGLGLGSMSPQEMKKIFETKYDD